MNPNQQPQYNNVPSIKQPGNWSPMNDPSYNLPPPKKSLFGRYKKLIIIAAVALILLIGVAVLAAVTSTKSDQSQNLSGATTSVKMTNYDGQKFSMQYPEIANKVADEASDAPDSWFLLLMDQSESPKYKISVLVSSDDPFYADDENAISELVDNGIKPSSFKSSDVVMAGNKTTKGEAEYTDNNGQNFYARYAHTKIGDKNISVFMYNTTDNTQLNDSFDATVGSIKLK